MLFYCFYFIYLFIYLFILYFKFDFLKKDSGLEFCVLVTPSRVEVS